MKAPHLKQQPAQAGTQSPSKTASTLEKAPTPSAVTEQPAKAQPTKTDKPKANPLDYVQKNYCKFDSVEKPLQELLEEGHSAKEIAAALNISLPTFYKYKGIVVLKTNKQYSTQEERAFLEKQEKRAALARVATPASDASAATVSSSKPDKTGK